MRTSYSAIQTFKACRRLYELKYIHGLELITQSDAINRGVQYHELVEDILSGGTTSYRFSDCDNPKVKAMATAFQMYVAPNIQAKAVEQWFRYFTKSGHLIVGRLDGKTLNDEVIEHKTTSGLVDGDYFARLDLDEQIPTYMLACKSNYVWYTVCSTPSIRQRKGETDEEFYLRCVDWFSEDTEHKITFVKLFRDDDSLKAFADEQDAIVSEMESCKLFYRNPSNCMKWGRMCEYAPVCMNYDPNKDYIQFKRREDYYEKAGKAEVRAAYSQQLDDASKANKNNH